MTNSTHQPPATANGRPRDEAVLARVRQEFANARQAGQRRPGRPSLVDRIPGATDYQVRQAIKHAKTTPHHSTSNQHPGDQRQDTDQDTGQDTASPTTTSTAVTPDPEPTAAEEPSTDVAGDTGALERVRVPRPWPLALIGAAAGVAVWGGWVDLGKLTGFGLVQPLPGLVDDLKVNTAIVLPLGIEAYGGYALRVWLSAAALSERTRRYACWSAWASLMVGGAAQVASHLMKAAHLTTAPWWVTVLVSCVPVAVLGLATGLATLVRQDTLLTTSPHHSPTARRRPTRRRWRFWRTNRQPLHP